jgi:hypothetical protein
MKHRSPTFYVKKFNTTRRDEISFRFFIHIKTENCSLSLTYNLSSANRKMLKKAAFEFNTRNFLETLSLKLTINFLREFYVIQYDNIFHMTYLGVPSIPTMFSIVFIFLFSFYTPLHVSALMGNLQVEYLYVHSHLCRRNSCHKKRITE